MLTDNDLAVVSIGDAFGNALRRFWKEGRRRGIAFEIAERDDGYVTALDIAHYFLPSDFLGPLDRWACDHAGGRVLDVGCGAGRHAVPLLAAGHDVVGLDTSPGAVEVARLRGVNAVLGSVDSLGEYGEFATALLLGNNLGLLESAERGPQVLRQLAAAVRPGGRLLCSGIDPATEDQPEHLAYQKANRACGRMPGQLRIRIRDRCLSSGWFDYLHLSLDELRDLAADTPWTVSDWFTGPIGYVALLIRGDGQA